MVSVVNDVTSVNGFVEKKDTSDSSCVCECTDSVRLEYTSSFELCVENGVGEWIYVLSIGIVEEY